MKSRTAFLFGLIGTLAVAPAGWAQPTAPTAAPPANLWTFLLPPPSMKAACKDCFCNSPIGKMAASATAPMSAMTGGLVTNRCAKNAIDNALKLDPKGETASGAAAAIKKDEAEVKARREAIRYLGTVDCTYWPEATAALKTALRGDKSECVRFEAALALRNGCCCNEETIKALEYCVDGSNKDGHPAEKSDRVRAAAAEALARCPMPQKTGGGTEKIKEKNGEKVPMKTDAGPLLDPTNSRGVLVSMQGASGTTSAQRSGSLAGVFSHAFMPSSTAMTASRTPSRQVSLYDALMARNTRTSVGISGMTEHIVPASASGQTQTMNGVVTVESFQPMPSAPRTGRP